MKKKSKSNQTLSEKIADALTVKPRADIEEDVIFGSKPKTVQKSDLLSSESEDEALISQFRKANTKHLSEISKKYEGEVVNSSIDHQSSSGAESEEEQAPSDSEDFDSDEDNNEYSITETQTNSLKSVHISSKSENDSESENDEVSHSESEEESDSENDDEECYDISQMDEPISENFEVVKKQNLTEEVKKGDAVRNQLQLWENLLEMRIHLQRCLNSANRMPLPAVYDSFKKDSGFTEACNVAKTNVGGVLDKLISLRNLLLSKNPETKNLSDKKSAQVEVKPVESDEEIPSDDENSGDDNHLGDAETEKPSEKEKQGITKVTQPRKRKLNDYESDIAKTHTSFKQFRNSTISKWHEKTRIINSASLKNKQSNSILQQIDYILSDRNKLLKRTQLKRSEYDIVGHKGDGNSEEALSSDRKEGDEYISEIFDDSDFYHQLLRELIECKSADITDPVQLSRQWIALQQMRSKMKRKVDMKATKGRRIKYVVHNKLINFMAPEKNVHWTDEMRNELYSSLFGKMFEYQNSENNSNKT